MTASHRLRIVRNISASGATYGSGDYGDGIYGERATDPADQQSYVALTPSGTTDIRVRAGDSQRTITLVIVAFGGPFEDGEGSVLDLSTVDTATLHLERVSRGARIAKELAMTVDTGNDQLARKLTASDFAEPGRYAAHVVLTFTSGRQLTVPPVEPPTITVTEGA